MKIAVAGTGYVGLVTACSLAHVGHYVICVDINDEKINLLKNGKCPIYEKDLEKSMIENKSRLEYTTNYIYAYQNSDIIIIGVGTPEKDDGSANLDYVYSVCDNIIESIKSDVIVIIKSTVPIGTNDEIDKYFKNNSKYNISVVSNPEFLSQGTALHDTLYAKRIVVGVENEFSRDVMKKLYEPFTKEPYNIPYLEMDRKSAELVKYASNSFLALKISYINEIANLSSTVGADISNVTLGMGYDDRIGNKFLNPGIGYGGSCFPKDTMALYTTAKKNNLELKTIKATIDVNNKQKLKFIDLIKNKFNTLNDLNIAILGVTFKTNTDDLRESPALYNINELLKYNCNIHVYDPIGINNLKKIYKNKIYYHDNIDDTIYNKDVAIIFTDWDIIKNYNLKNYSKYMKTPIIYDGRNCYNINEVKNNNLEYISIGRVIIKNEK